MKIAILALVALLANVTSDEIRFRYSRLFGKILNNKLAQWFNPAVSWQNKYYFKNKFLTFLLSTGFVFLTDLWHFLKFVTLNCIFLILIILLEPSRNILLTLLFWNLCWGVLYEFFKGIYGLLSDKE
jgi:hypothetical protein